MANAIQIGNAPCSWGMLEFEGLEGEPIGYAQMLNELRETGYTGTELGDWGYMPTEPSILRTELEQRGLAMTGAFVPVDLKHRAAHDAGVVDAVRTAHLLAAVSKPDQPPFLVLADVNGTDPTRTKYAGRITPEQGLSAAEWQTYAAGAEHVARAVRDETGLRTVFHHHCAGYVETPDEIAHFLELTDPNLLGLVFDAGHYVYGTGSNDGSAVVEGLHRFSDRIWYVHFKDCEPRVAAQARAEDWDYFAAIAKGVFCELGKGCVDFPALVTWLRERNYAGYLTVEQDVLPGMGAPRESARRNREYIQRLGL